MPVLKSDAKCAWCGELMMSGEQFRWMEKQVASGRKVGSFRTTNRPAHVDQYCAARKFAAEQIENKIADLDRTIATVLAILGCEAALDVLRCQIDEERAKLAGIASW
jgi:hypothetical protein